MTPSLPSAHLALQLRGWGTRPPVHRGSRCTQDRDVKYVIGVPGTIDLSHTVRLGEHECFERDKYQIRLL